MKSNYKKLGDYIKQFKEKNKDLKVKKLQGVSINKEFMPSVANVIGTDLSNYKIVKKGQFAYNPMHVGRDEVLPISLLQEDESIIVSPAFVVFEILDTNELDPEYLMMWFRRKEFDRRTWFTTDDSIRGGFKWGDLCKMDLPVPDINTQKEIVKEYNKVINRIYLNNKLIQKSEETAQTIFKHWFVDFEFPNENGNPYQSYGGEMEYNEELDKEIPKGWDIKPISKVIPVKDGTHDSPEPTSNGYPLVTSTHLRPYDLKLNETYNISQEDFVQVNKRSKVDTYDILFSMIGTVGDISFVLNDEINFAIKNVGLFKTSEKKSLAEYILFYLKSDIIKQYIKISLLGSTQNYVTLTYLREIPCLLPTSPTLNIFKEKLKTIINCIFTLVKENNLNCVLKEILLEKMTKV